MKNKEKGITLIALIITIIVMLILVAVTINVALNGGLFDKAKKASNKTNLAKEKEILQTIALGYLDNNGYVDLAKFASKESPLEGYTLTNNTNYVIASNGTTTFYITKQGGITETEPQNVVPQEPQTPIVTGYTLNSNFEALSASMTHETEYEEHFYINYDTDEERGIEVIYKNYHGTYTIIINDNEEILYVYPVTTILDFDDTGIDTTGGEWTKIIIGDTLSKDENFSQSNFPVYNGYITCGMKDEEDNGKTLADANIESGVAIFVVQ